MGGVILDLDITEALVRFKELGMSNIETYLDPYEQKDFFLELEQGKVSASQFCQKLSQLTGKDISYEQAQWAWLGFIVDVPQYKLDYIEELKKNYNVHLLSNTNPFIMGWTRSSEFTPSKRPITDYFDKIYASYEVGATKPDKKIFEFMIEDSEMIPSETLFVDDGKKNIEIGEELGFKTYMPANKEDWRSAIDNLIK